MVAFFRRFRLLASGFLGVAFVSLVVLRFGASDLVLRFGFGLRVLGCSGSCLDKIVGVLFPLGSGFAFFGLRATDVTASGRRVRIGVLLWFGAVLFGCQCSRLHVLVLGMVLVV